MPGIDGVEACRRIREFSSAYVLMLTAQDSELDKVVGFGAGADDYVTKPFSMSREIRSPLSGIAGAAELLLADEADDERRELAAIVRDAAGTLSRLLDDVLDGARVEAGHIGLEAADYDPRRLVATVAGVLRPGLRDRPIELAAEVDGSVPAALHGDAGLRG